MKGILKFDVEKFCHYSQFYSRHEEFDQAIQCLTILDVICSLAEYARTYSQDICIPDVQQFNEKVRRVGREITYSMHIFAK